MKKYENLKKKYALPEFEELNKYFEIDEEDEKNLILREIIKKIQEKINQFAHLLQEMLNPEDISSSHESGTFTEDEKKNILKLYQKICYLSRKKILVDIEYDEELCANFVKESYEEYKEIVPELKKVVNKIKDSWNKSEKKKIELSYFG